MKLPFNISYSAYSLFKSSPLQFYFQYVIKAQPTDKAISVYGNAGNVVHDCVEHYIKTGEDIFEEKWESYKIDSKRGINGSKLSKSAYNEMWELAKNICNSELKYGTMEVEKKVELPFCEQNMKGFFDIHLKQMDGSYHIYDWKTNSSHSEEMHKAQRLFYSWMHYKLYEVIPTTTWIYLKTNIRYTNTFTISEIMDFENQLRKDIATMIEWGDDILYYQPGDWGNPFNQYAQLCIKEIKKRQQSVDGQIIVAIRGHWCYFESVVDPEIEKAIDNKTKFDLPQKHYMQQAVKNKATSKNIDVRDVGTVHIYMRQRKAFPIGILPIVIDVVEQYNSYYKKNISLVINDYRDKNIMHQRLGGMPQKLHSEFELRDYQLEAVEACEQNHYGILDCPTSSGKTMISAEFVRRVDGRTLWIVDRKELLNQTKSDLEGFLGQEIGVIAGKTFEPKQINIAMVQTLASHIDDKHVQELLYNTNVVIVDEFHKAAAETYQKVFAKLVNNKYRIGMTGTVKREDAKEPILFSVLGDVIYTVKAKDLIEKGFIMKPTIEFYEMPDSYEEYIPYQDDYRNSIVENDVRNESIRKLVNYYGDKKILIVTKLIEHGSDLHQRIPNSKYLHGSVDDDERKEIMEWFQNTPNAVMIGTISIFAEGINVPSMNIIINACGNAGDVKTIQTLGRVLRKADGKEKAHYIDFIDGGKYTFTHSQARMSAFEEQGHTVTTKKFTQIPVKRKLLGIN